jgi:hypothetical protein
MKFGRSAWFGLIGVFVVAAVVIVIALTADSSDASPKLQYGLIFGVVGVFFFTLLLLQRADLNRASAGDERSVAKGPQEIDDPTRLEDGELWAALAVRPIDEDAVKARREMWGAGRRSIKLGAVIGLLIFLTVPSIYLFDTFVPLLIGGPLIVIAALYGSWRAIGAGGEVDTAYELLDRSMKPLGLGVNERPDVRMVARAPSMPGYSARLIGPLVMTGERHGRRVEVRQEQNRSEISLGTKVAKFDARVKRGRFVGDDGGSSVPAALTGLKGSDRWKGVEVHGGPTGILVQRKGDLGAWLCDLWLAERLADQT